MPTVLDKQGAQLLAVAVLVVSRTWISDRIASLNGIIMSELSCHIPLFKLLHLFKIMFTLVLIVNVLT